MCISFQGITPRSGLDHAHVRDCEADITGVREGFLIQTDQSTFNSQHGNDALPKSNKTNQVTQRFEIKTKD